jgi:RimK family alpha-L-glutamate ligase
LQGYGARLPDAVLVRAIGKGTFEAVTTRLSILHALSDIGVMVSNAARIVEVCVDKAATSFYIARANIPTPPTWTVQTSASARAIVRREAAQGPLVLKPLFGSQGAGLMLIRTEADLPNIDAAQGVFYLQKYIGVERDGFRDLRVLVSGNEVVAAMSRHARHWITNVKLGAKPEPVEIDAETRALALRSAQAVGAHFCGVDLLRGPDDRLMVIEVNSMPGWRGLQTVTGFSIAERLAADFLARLSESKAQDASAVAP